VVYLDTVITHTERSKRVTLCSDILLFGRYAGVAHQ